MIKFNKILVPLDCSEYSKAALKYAVDLARGSGGEILALHVVESVMMSTAYITPMGGYSSPYPDVMKAAEDYMATLQPLIEGMTCRTLIRTGEPGQEIVDAATEEGADIIVMATHGRGGLTRLVLGSTAEAVMRHATVPVLTLRAALLLKSEAPPELSEVAEPMPRMAPL